MTATTRHWFASLLRTRTLAAALLLSAAALFIDSYISTTRNMAPLPNTHSIVALILVTLILLLMLGIMVIRRAVRLRASLREGSVGSRMQTRIVVMFTWMTIIPTVIVSVFSWMLFNFGIHSWFDDRVSTTLDESVAVAEAYLGEHKDIIRADARAMSGDIDQKLTTSVMTPAQFGDLVNRQAAGRWLTEAVVFQEQFQQMHILAQAQLTFSLEFAHLPAAQLERADHGEVVVTLEDQDKVRALVKLKSLPNAYLLVGRFIDSKVLSHVDTANGSVQQYRRLRDNISHIQIDFSIVFLLLAMLLLFTAIWYGMRFATRIFGPITKLVGAAERVRAGDYTARVAEGPKDDEVGTLARAFNRMTDELERQRKDLIEANRQLDTRRRFTETVLSGVSAGVVALGRDKRVTLANPVAGSLLLVPAGTELKGELITQVVPEFVPLLAQLEENTGVQAQGDVTIARSDKTHVLHVRVAAERILDSIEGYIITFDDITELLTAQRRAAWSDVARRVAHEIKNPLTPIQLSAERLRKKYVPKDKAEAENYLKYVDTIGKHVNDIGRIVEEFAMFARMPAPVMKRENIAGVLRKAVFSEQTGHPGITYRLQLEDKPVYVLCDEQQISRVLLNVLKNAAEAFEAQPEESKKSITVECSVHESQCRIRISDNGPGFPTDKMHRLLEPYVTTRAKGTGLGLAIVKKIVDDHKAQLTLENLAEGGACVTISFPLDRE